MRLTKFSKIVIKRLPMIATVMQPLRAAVAGVGPEGKEIFPVLFPMFSTTFLAILWADAVVAAGNVRRVVRT